MSFPHDAANDSGSHFRYWAFISYSQRDAELAQSLHKKLETFRVPRNLVGRCVRDRTIPRRLIPIFRDRDELPSAGDLTGKIRQALEASYALIVICSPYAAASPWVNEEIRTFKELGRADRIFPFIVDGEPYASDRPALGLPECFPPALRFAVADDGTLTDRRSDPLAADARKGKDGRSNALLKLIAGLLGIGFDDLRRRELARQRQRRQIVSLACVAAGLAMVAMYVGLADTGINLPGSSDIRLALDRHGLSIFRPIASHAEVVREAAASRKVLRGRLLDAIRQGKVSLQEASDSSIWELAQIAAAIYRDPDSNNDEIRLLTPLLHRIFQEDFLLMSNGKLIGWSGIGWSGEGPSRRAETALWMMMALSHALGRKDAEIEAVRTRFAGYLQTVQQIAENYYPLDDGGWNMVIQDKPEAHNLYSSALALHALVELDSASLCWRGDCQRLAVMVRDAAQRFVRTFVDVGWPGTMDDNSAPDPDVSLMIYGALVRAGASLPDNIRAAALRQMSDLRLRPYSPAYHDIRHWVSFINDRGKPESLSVPTRVFWYPWAIEALLHWQRYADQQNLAPEIRRALERSLGHALISSSKDMRDDMAQTALYAVAETYYGMGGVR
jgi:hypothetical protein